MRVLTDASSDDFARQKSVTLMLSFLYPFFTGTIGSFTVLFAKASTDLIVTTIEGDGDHSNQFDHPVPYLIVLATLAIGATQIHWLNRGLAKYNQLIIIPVFSGTCALR